MKNLTELRKDIDQIDTELLNLLSQRIKIVQEVGVYKKQNNLPIIDPEREQAIIDLKKEQAKNLDLSADFIQKIWRTLFDEAYKQEEDV